MFPVLLKIGPLAIRTYGLLVAIGFFIALQYILLRSKQKHIPEVNVLDVVLYTMLAGLVGGRLTYVVFNWAFYSKHLIKIFQIWEGGLVFYGGFMLGAIVLLIYCKHHPEIKFWNFIDILAPAIALGHFFGRLGCFFAGCCYGLPTTMPWGIKFTNSDALAPLNIHLHPTQIYESVFNIGIFFLLDWFNRFNHRKGQSMGAYLFLYGIARFHVEFLRGDERGGFLFGISPSQIIALLFIVVSIIVLMIRKEKRGINVADS